MTEHISNLVSRASQSLYALKIIKSNGLAARHLNSVCQATLVSPMTYASPAWWGFANIGDLTRVQSVLNRGHRWGFTSAPDPPNFNTICAKVETKFFNKICSLSNHVLHCLLPAHRHTSYNPYSRSLTLPFP